jgi:hypothetical protein
MRRQSQRGRQPAARGVRVYGSALERTRCTVSETGVTSPDVQLEIVTLSLSYETVDLPNVDAKEIRDRLVEGRVLLRSSATC